MQNQDEASKKLRASAAQLVRIIRCLGIYLLFIALALLVQSVTCWVTLNQDEFNDVISNRAYA